MEVDAGLYLADALIGLSSLDQAGETLTALKASLNKRASACASGIELTLNARLCWKRKQMDLARSHYRRAFELLEINNDCQYDCARAYIPFAEFLLEEGEIDSAESALQKGREIFTRLNNQLGLEMVEQAQQKLRGRFD